MGWKNAISCEINLFGNRILKYYWPNAYHHKDIKTLNYETINTELTRRFGQDWRDNKLILTGGFPCQPYSTAGKRKGKEDERHLWPEMLRIIRELHPSDIVGENVSGMLNWSGGLVFDEVQADLEAEGYQVLPFLLPACGVGAPHRRDRIWFIAHATGSTTGSPGQSRGIKGHGSKDNDEQSERGTQAKLNSGCSELLRTIINPSSQSDGGHNPGKGEGTGLDMDRNRLDETQRKEGADNLESSGFNAANSENIGLQPSGQTREWGTGFKDGDSGKDRNVADSNIDERSQGRMHSQGRETAERHTGTCDASRFRRETWDKFPTQSPVCTRNDGFSTGLDFKTVFEGIDHPRKPLAFGKWRNESITAAGNAIVPQVAYQIFKAIEQMNKGM